MARGELLRKLFQGHRRGNDEEFRAAALEIIAEEERKNNHRLAKDLVRILENNGTALATRSLTNGNVTSVPKDRERETPLVDVRHPERTNRDILLDDVSKSIIDRIINEQRKSELLRVHGMKPASKLLFCGPPGCGKTLCSEIIASELGLPMLYTRFDAIVSSYLGETAANLRRVFEYAASGRWVVLFDEFDAIGKARDDATEHGELKRVINSFLQLLDSFSASSILIAATNHEHLLDPALWRRFDETVLFPRPTQNAILTLLQMKLRNFPHKELQLNAAATSLKGMSHAEIERVCFDAIKDAILHDAESVDQPTFKRAVQRQRDRASIKKSATFRRKS